MNKIKAVIFDMNGVLINDSGPVSIRVEKEFHVPADEIWPLLKDALAQVRVPGADSRQAWKPVLDRLNISYSQFFKFWFDGESLNQELLDHLKTLKAIGLKIIVLSNNFPERTNNYRHLYPELFEEIDQQYFSWETGYVKPDPKSFTQIIENHDFSPGEYLYFDDNEGNLKAATNLGIISHKFAGLTDTKSFLAQSISK
ncbi:MAG: HAD hydrolase, family IA, variant 3 [Candidatus Collierbacteria bacterium GW2011_GWB1_44_6]|uniref:HAD hydrolase, family IA, variant 3 n=2 Tax=Candidatus Collieribacteriota TaxID=1752725 RepID=A0A0G1LX41_9BACT|nr:MAG: HAD hydrolase, family IA, variant 3 [Candidatus Collierbacteria bacterium GW2011_GWC2_43_12]KKT73392.1 MAG: HAD hydrolase, family IA, variant 3 [Candidatus Collierbacteria bacterium GW2011_GWB1_44_6]KKT82914.1 MAG: hypothetical protein UW80_C0027G0020 [Microgenomates group bacterium GW2011_GWC1_44_9]